MTNISKVWVDNHHREGFPIEHEVGVDGVTSIELIMKGALHCDVPYIYVYKSGELFAEFMQHGVKGIYYEPVA